MLGIVAVKGSPAIGGVIVHGYVFPMFVDGCVNALVAGASNPFFEVCVGGESSRVESYLLHGCVVMSSEEREEEFLFVEFVVIPKGANWGETNFCVPNTK